MIPAPPYSPDPTDRSGMVKYGPASMEPAAERLSRYAWGSQDGGAHEAVEQGPSSTQRSGANRTSSQPGKVSPLPRRSPGKKRGLSLVRLPCDDIATESAVNAEEPSLKQIMEAIYTCQTTLTEHIDGMRAEMSFLKQDVQTIRERASEAEQRISDMEDVVWPMEGKVQYLHKEINAHTDNLGDMEDRQRRNNVRFVGFPEKAEGTQPEDFLELWLKDNMADTTFSRLFAIERAHRIPSKPPPPGAHPRPMIARILHFRDRESIFRAACTGGELQYNGNRISIYPDFSAATQKQRASFIHVKKRLRDLQLPYSMLYPAKLRVVDGGKVSFFNNPTKASRWLDSRGRRSPVEHR